MTVFRRSAVPNTASPGHSVPFCLAFPFALCARCRCCRPALPSASSLLLGGGWEGQVAAAPHLSVGGLADSLGLVYKVGLGGEESVGAEPRLQEQSLWPMLSCQGRNAE